MDKSRAVTVPITGTSFFGGSASPPAPTAVSMVVPEWEQRTRTHLTGWPLVRNWYKKGYKSTRPEFDEFLSRQDFGASFRTELSTVKSSLANVTVPPTDYSVFRYGVEHLGPVLNAGATPLTFTGDAGWSALNQELFGLGGSAIARVRPAQPQLNLSVTIGELRFGGLPRLIGTLSERARTVKELFREGGSEYLNVKFGWEPLVRDIVALAESAAKSRQMLEQYERDVGRLVRRRYQFEPRSDTVVGQTGTSGSYAFYPLTPLARVTTTAVRPYQNLAAEVVEINKTTVKSWFSGGFRYYFEDIPEGLEFFGRIEREANHLLGTRLDPEVLWNLQPWTWLTDWFVNAGDVLSNVSAYLADHVVMQYGYIMQTRRQTRTVCYPGLQMRTNQGFVTFTKPWEVTQTLTRKARVKASPFGFGLDPSAFTANQWAILGALGISRGLR